MAINESKLRQIIREETAATLQESFLSKTADFFGSSNRAGKEVKMRAFDLLDHASFERWPGSSTWERKLRDITKMGQHTAAESLRTVQGAEEAFKDWMRRDADARASAEDERWRGADARRRRGEEERMRSADAESKRRREEFRKKLDSEDLVPTGEDASGNLMYTTRSNFERQRSSGRSPVGSLSMRESRIVQIIREEARRALREGLGSREPRGDDRWVLADIPDDLLDAVIEDPKGRAADRLWDALHDAAISSGDFGPHEAGDEATAMLDRFMAGDFLRWERARRDADRDDGGRMREGIDDDVEFDAFLTILNVSELTDAMDMSPEDLVTMLEDIAHRDFRGRVVLTGEDGGGHVPDGPPYSEEYDAIGAMGNRRDLERFVRVVENEIQGPAQSMEEGEGLEYEIQDF